MKLSVFRNFFDSASRYIQMCLLALGIAMLSVYALAQMHTQLGRAQALSAFDEEQFNRSQSAASSRANKNEAPDRPKPGIDSPNQSLWGESRISAYKNTSDAAIESPAGVLSIPGIDLRVPIFHGDGELALNRGVGRIPGTARIGEGGNLGLAGHRDGFFRGLKDVTLGDIIDVQSHDGSTRYRVTEMSIVSPDDISVLYPTEQTTLTLVTCYPFYFIGSAPQRYIVKGVAVPSESASRVN